MMSRNFGSDRNRGNEPECFGMQWSAVSSRASGRIRDFGTYRLMVAMVPKWIDKKVNRIVYG